MIGKTIALHEAGAGLSMALGREKDKVQDNYKLAMDLSENGCRAGQEQLPRFRLDAVADFSTYYSTDLQCMPSRLGRANSHHRQIILVHPLVAFAEDIAIFTTMLHTPVLWSAKA